MNLHILFQCKQNQEARKHIYESITIELDYYMKKHRIPLTLQEILPTETANRLLDAAVTGEVKQNHFQDLLTTLLGANLAVKLPDYITNQIKRMLISHLILLMKTFCTITKPEEFTTIETENLEVATEDIHKGKIVVRAKEATRKLYYKNIRPILEQFTIPEMQYSEIGLGSANTRTKTQQKLANEYTRKIVEQAYENLIFVDGSINSKDNPNHNKYSQEG